MSLHYLLDGYNIIHQIPKLANGTLEEQRQKLIAYIEQLRPQGSPSNQVTIVFDGQPQMMQSLMRSPVKVTFSQNESADDKIKKLVYEAGNKKNIVVVTNDRDIQYAVRALGAKVLAVDAFFEAGKAPSKVDSEDKHISKIVESKITDELQSIWLKKKKE